MLPTVMLPNTQATAGKVTLTVWNWFVEEVGEEEEGGLPVLAVYD